MRKTKRISMYGMSILSWLIVLASGCSNRISEETVFEKAEIEWREERERAMASPTSWLTIAGLFWLEEGNNSFGTVPGNSIRLPEGSAPPFAGSFILRNDEIRVKSSMKVPIRCEGEVVDEMVLRSDADGRPDVIEFNDLKLWVIKRGDRYAIRLRDLNSPRYKKHSRLKFFPPRKRYQVKAEFATFPEPKIITLATVIGTETEMVSPGQVKFQIDGVDLRLDAFEAGNDSTKLFMIFRDKTSGDQSYGACRFMVAEILDDGSVDLNFNRAYNPPCAYTPYATCPLPPPQNDLPVKIEAGEKIYMKAH